MPFVDTTQRSDQKFSGLIDLEDFESPTPEHAKLSSKTLTILDNCVERPNVVVATIGWEDGVDSGHLEDLEAHHKERVQQWRPFAKLGASVVRLSALGKTSEDVFHTPLDLVKIIIRKTGRGGGSSGASNTFSVGR
ncbi:hypothetical protein DXG01_002427 [Tephrocybe rancida]|nr:hypothetical protein DXG01_002427 [Tephrocybe rancida]